MPQGPAHAVPSLELSATQVVLASGGGGPSTEPSGCPDRKRDSSDLGPAGPCCLGVWQPLHPMAETRYFPRTIRPFAVANGVARARPSAAAASASASDSRIPVRPISTPSFF